MEIEYSRSKKNFEESVSNLVTNTERNFGALNIGTNPVKGITNDGGITNSGGIVNGSNSGFNSGLTSGGALTSFGALQGAY